MNIKLSQQDRETIEQHLSFYLKSNETLKMKKYIQHGNITTYEHVMNVVCFSYWISQKLNIHIDESSLIIGAYLHDFYLYDWHENGYIGRFHGLTHPEAALKNAESRYSLNDKVKNIIISHMWPLTIRNYPKYRESIIVCLADKYCALCETFYL